MQKINLTKREAFVFVANKKFIIECPEDSKWLQDFLIKLGYKHTDGSTSSKNRDYSYVFTNFNHSTIYFSNDEDAFDADPCDMMDMLSVRNINLI